MLFHSRVCGNDKEEKQILNKQKQKAKDRYTKQLFKKFDSIVLFILIFLSVTKYWIIYLQNQQANNLADVSLNETCQLQLERKDLTEEEKEVFIDLKFDSVGKFGFNDLDGEVALLFIGKTRSNEVLANVSKLESLKSRKVKRINTIYLDGNDPVGRITFNDDTRGYFWLICGNEYVTEFKIGNMFDRNEKSFVYVDFMENKSESTEMIYLEKIIEADCCMNY